MYRYVGNHLSEPTEKKNGEVLTPYLPDFKLVRAVNYAIVLKRPLLLKGEPGCGKTLLAKDVADEFGVYPDRYFEWRIKSTTKAQEGIYTFDHLKRLQDVQAKRGFKNVNLPLIKYINQGPLYQAFKAAKENPNEPVVLLIDEIDKADIDFPNDLLHEIEQKSFTISELDSKKYRAEEREIKVPQENNLIIFITSNNEKELPAAFLRRCLFHYIDPLGKDQLEEIINKNFPNFDKNLIDKILQKFDDVRQLLKQEISNEKRPSTSELLDWVRLLNHYIELGDEKTRDQLMEDFSNLLLKSENALTVIRDSRKSNKNEA